MRNKAPAIVRIQTAGSIVEGEFLGLNGEIEPISWLKSNGKFFDDGSESQYDLMERIE